MKSTKQCTHTGLLIADARAKNKKTRLRETALYWITETGTKFKKSNGWVAGPEPWPIYHLALDSIKLIGKG